MPRRVIPLTELKEPPMKAVPSSRPTAEVTKPGLPDESSTSRKVEFRDPSALSNRNPPEPPARILPLKDGRILAGGSGGFLLLNADGSRNSTFREVLDSSGSPGFVTSAVGLDDGTAFIGGSFSSVSGITRRGIARVFLEDSRTAFQFASSDYAVSEDGGAVTVTVERLGETSGAQTVSYLTFDGSATAGADYSAQ